MDEILVGEERVIEVDNGPAQNPQVLLHKEVIGMFPELDLTDTIREYGHMTSEGLASWIVDNMNKIPKRRGMKRKAVEENPDTPESIHSEDSNSTELDTNGDLLVDKMLSDLIHKIRIELRSNKTNAEQHISQREMKACKNFLCDQFTGVRADFVLKIIQTFKLAIVPSAIACFLVENNFGVRLQKLIPNLSQHFWCKAATPMQTFRKKKLGTYQSGEFQSEFDRYINILTNYREGEYNALITPDFKLSKQFNLIKWERNEQEKTIECLVCFDLFPVNRMIFCNAPTAHQESFFADNSILTPKEEEDKPGPSRLLYHENERASPKIKMEQTNSILDKQTDTLHPIISYAEKGNTSSAHAFCRACVRGQANAATDEQPLADGGVGLRCMAPDCKNPILYSEIRMILSRDIQKKLDERIFEENIGLASLHNLERCKRCNFAVEMEIDKTVNKVFDCLNCGSKFCRNCDREWDDDHFGISCGELDIKLKKDKKSRDMEKELNEAIIRKCPQCGIAFMKYDGCNKMTCRCGMTQCYICRKSKIDYSHFCQHLRDPRQPNWKCKECTKTCLLYEDANKKDEQLINEIRKKNDETTSANQETETGQSTSNSSIREPHGTANHRNPRLNRAGNGRFHGPNHQILHRFPEYVHNNRANVHPLLPPHRFDTPRPGQHGQNQGQQYQPQLHFQPGVNGMPFRLPHHPNFYAHQPMLQQPNPQLNIPLPPAQQIMHPIHPPQHQHHGLQLQHQAFPRHIAPRLPQNQDHHYFQQPFVGYLFGGGPLGNNPIIAGQPIPTLPPHFQQARNQNEHYQNHQAAIQMPPVADMEQVMQQQPLQHDMIQQELELLDQHLNQIQNQAINAIHPEVIDLELDEMLDLAAAPVNFRNNPNLRNHIENGNPPQ